MEDSKVVDCFTCHNIQNMFLLEEKVQAGGFDLISIGLMSYQIFYFLLFISQTSTVLSVIKQIYTSNSRHSREILRLDLNKLAQTLEMRQSEAQRARKLFFFFFVIPLKHPSFFLGLAPYLYLEHHKTLCKAKWKDLTLIEIFHLKRVRFMNQKIIVIGVK